jgi:hypothetical protein
LEVWQRRVILCIDRYRAVAWGGRPRLGDPGREGGREGRRTGMIDLLDSFSQWMVRGRRLRESKSAGASVCCRRQ